MFESITVPLKRAPMGPILISAAARMRSADSLMSDWQPGMHCLRISGSNNASHTFALGAAILCVPVICMRVLLLPSFCSLRLVDSHGSYDLLCIISMGASRRQSGTEESHEHER